ncbi:MAG: hypothetical protein ACE14T_03635 [Syntrophales bacterium]
MKNLLVVIAFISCLVLMGIGLKTDGTIGLKKMNASGIHNEQEEPSPSPVPKPPEPEPK